MTNSEKAQEIINGFVELVKSGNMPKAIAEVTFPPLDVPSSKWSLNNRLAMMLQGTIDARGFRQWDTVDRSVKAGSHAVYILAPMERFINEVDKDTGEDKPRRIISGFRAVPVFRVEDTHGKELEYQKLEVPKLPLMEVAEAWNIPVKASAFMGGWLGCYSHRDAKTITIASPTEKTFFHELSHASQDRLGMIKEGANKNWLEITAELSALVLAELCGLTIEQQNKGSTFDYIKMFAKTDSPEAIGKEVLKVIKDIDAIVQNIVSVSKIAMVAV